jgi:SWI/SNF-related matrix-associated actin-dependent regulator of chromatin subfamily A member 5
MKCFVETKTVDEVKEYSKVFWAKVESMENGEKYIERIEKGEKDLQKLNEIHDTLELKFNSMLDDFSIEAISIKFKKNNQALPLKSQYSILVFL